MSHAAYDADHPVITVTSTVIDGTVVRWFASLNAAINQRPALSAGRRGVSVHAEYLTDVPPAWVDKATEIYLHLAADPDADLGHLATHRRRFLSGPFEEISHG